MRPTGRLHIGHYFGALQNWVKLQNDPDYECFYFIADWHALTSDYADTSAVAENTLQITIDYLASGLDPAKSTFFVQSFIPEHAELHLLLSMITPLGWLERVPTYKEALDNIKDKDLHTYGFLGYPTLQTADIVMYSEPGKGLYVPVGEDQVSHVEFSRELVRRFDVFYRPLFNEQELATLKEKQINALFPVYLNPSETGAFNWSAATPEERRQFQFRMLREQMLRDGRKNYLERVPEELRRIFQTEELLTEPTAMLTRSPRVPGLDGRKMSKSYNNAIMLSESDADIRSKTKVMVTDPARKRRTDPGNPDVCPVYDWHKLFSTPERDPGRLEWVRTGCTTAGIGCIECKAAMADNLIKWIAPVRERRVKYEQNPKQVLEILDAGSAKARESAKETMGRVREAVFHWEAKRGSL
jgi:tryptophanyl-tRNA synthetase